MSETTTTSTENMDGVIWQVSTVVNLRPARMWSNMTKLHLDLMATDLFDTSSDTLLMGFLEDLIINSLDDGVMVTFNVDGKVF